MTYVIRLNPVLIRQQTEKKPSDYFVVRFMPNCCINPSHPPSPPPGDQLACTLTCDTLYQNRHWLYCVRFILSLIASILITRNKYNFDKYVITLQADLPFIEFFGEFYN